MTTIISMWSGPRNISTTMMRSFGNRADADVIDEPFYGHYLVRSGADHPYRKETLDAYPSEFGEVIDWIARARAKPVLFLKNIAYHLSDDADLAFLLAQRNFLLIREPRAMIASFADKFDDAAPIIRSFAIARRIFEFLSARGTGPPVVDAADVLSSPEKMLRGLCGELGLRFDPAMLAWAPGPRLEDGPWAAHWYDAVRTSTGFKPPVEKKLNLSRQLEELADEAAADYRFLHDLRLRA